MHAWCADISCQALTQHEHLLGLMRMVQTTVIQPAAVRWVADCDLLYAGRQSHPGMTGRSWRLRWRHLCCQPQSFLGIAASTGYLDKLAGGYGAGLR